MYLEILLLKKINRFKQMEIINIPFQMGKDKH